MPGQYGPHRELSFFLIQKELTIAPNGETFSPFVNPGIRLPSFSADVPKKCALIALHVMAEGGRDGKGFLVPELVDEWKMGCPKSPKWESEGEAWSGYESVSSTASHKGDMCNDALHVIGLHGSGGKIFLFLQNWEFTKVAPNCRVALDMRCQEINEAW